MHALLYELTIEPLLHAPPDVFPAGAPIDVISQHQRLPALVEFDRGHHDGTGLLDEGFGFGQDRISGLGVFDALADRIEALARQARDAAVPVPS